MLSRCDGGMRAKLELELLYKLVNKLEVKGAIFINLQSAGV